MEDHALRSRLIRLAHTNAELRPHILPLLGKQASGNEFPIRGLGVVLKGWALEQMKKWAHQANRDVVQEEELISIPDLYIERVEDHGNWIAYEIQDGGSFVFSLVVDMRKGTYFIET